MRNTVRATLDRLARLRPLALAALLALSLVALPACSGDEPSETGSEQTRASQAQAAVSQESPSEPDAVEPVPSDQPQQGAEPAPSAFDLSQVPAYDGSPYATVNGNVPTIGEADLPAASESYAPLDHLGRCGAAIAVVSPSTMPTEGEERGSIGMVKPTGWHTVRYDDLVDGRYLYNPATSSAGSSPPRTPTRRTSSPAPAT